MPTACVVDAMVRGCDAVVVPVLHLDFSAHMFANAATFSTL
jgi:hypothetical protein